MAIALDTSTYGSFVNPGTTLTWSHTVTGTNPVLFVGAIAATTDILTGITYNGVAMTLVGKGAGGSDRFIYLYVLAAPATGAHNIVVSSASSYLTGFATSYTGGHQTTPIDSFAVTTTAGADPLPGSTTVVAANCWLVATGRGTQSPVTAGALTTARAQESDFSSGGMYDSNGTVATGVRSLEINFSSSGAGAIIVASLAEAGGGGGSAIVPIVLAQFRQRHRALVRRPARRELLAALGRAA